MSSRQAATSAWREEEDDFDFAERFTSLKVEFESELEEEKKLNKLILANLAQIDVDGSRKVLRR
jgi:hypothetical protein